MEKYQVGKSITIEIPPVISKLELLTNRELRKAMRDAGDLILKEIENQFNRRGAVATGKTLGSIKRNKVRTDGNRLSVLIAPTGDRARAMTAIEFGRRKNKPFPPVARILEWMEARGLTDGLTPSKQRSVAYAIAKSIAEEGIEAKNIFEDTINSESLQAQISAVIDQAVRRVVASFNANSN